MRERIKTPLTFSKDEMNTVISFPVPPYQNLPIRSEFYMPSRFVIIAVNLGVTTVITTSTNNNYVIGQQVRLLIPSSFGTYQLNGRTAYVISIPNTNQVELNIDSNGMSAFTTSSNTTLPQILAIGDVNEGAINSFGRILQNSFIPGSFTNIS